MTDLNKSLLTIHQSFISPDDDHAIIISEQKNDVTISATGNIYTSGMFDRNLPELLVQDVPKAHARLVYQLLHRLSGRLQMGCQLYTDNRIMESNRYFRVIQVERVDHRLNLLDHVMTKWWRGRSLSMTDAVLSQVQIVILTPWFVVDMQEWASLPKAPRDRRECRDRIFLAALSLDCRGQGRYNDITKFSESDAAYFLKYQKHFVEILNVPNVQSFLYRMPPSFQHQVLAMGDRMTTAAALRISAQQPSPMGTARSTTTVRNHHSIECSRRIHVPGGSRRIFRSRQGQCGKDNDVDVDVGHDDHDVVLRECRRTNSTSSVERNSK